MRVLIKYCDQRTVSAKTRLKTQYFTRISATLMGSQLCSMKSKQQKLQVCCHIPISTFLFFFGKLNIFDLMRSTIKFLFIQHILIICDEFI